MINKKKEKKMRQVKTRVAEERSGNPVLQTFGALLIGVGILDFALSWAGTNITGFLGPISAFTPMAFGIVGAGLYGAGSGEDE